MNFHSEKFLYLLRVCLTLEWQRTLTHHRLIIMGFQGWMRHDQERSFILGGQNWFGRLVDVQRFQIHKIANMDLQSSSWSLPFCILVLRISKQTIILTQSFLMKRILYNKRVRCIRLRNLARTFWSSALCLSTFRISWDLIRITFVNWLFRVYWISVLAELCFNFLLPIRTHFKFGHCWHI